MASRTVIIGEAQLAAALKARAALLALATAAAVATEVQAVAADAKAGAPEADGELKASIAGRSQGSSGEVEATARHAPFQEFGTSRNRAQPYMAPAAATSRVRFIGRVRLAARKAVS